MSSTRKLAAVAALLLAAAAPRLAAAKIEHKPFGKLADGKPVEIFTLTNAKGTITASVITYGAILTRVQVPDLKGHVSDVLLGYDTLEKYEKDNGPHFGSLVGRVANRIAKGTFQVDGKTYHVPVNNGPNALHGGTNGYDKRLWTAEETTFEGGDAVKLSLVDPDGEQGFPGTVHASVTYSISGRDGLRLEYEATTDKPTPISLTSHGYWNLRDGGRSSILDEEMHFHADKYLPVDATQIPTGVEAPVAGTPFDFRRWKSIGQEIAATPAADRKTGYDHTMVIDGTPGTLRPAVVVYDPPTGRVMRMVTTEPGVQFYTGNFLDGTLTGRDGVAYKQNCAFALEAEGHPDAVNHASFPPVILRPGQAYHQVTEYQFGAYDHNPEK